MFLKSLKSQSKKVAVATVQSCDPTQKLDGVAIGNQFWLVRVSIVIADDEVLVRPYKNYKFMGDALGAHIAWPATLVCAPLIIFTMRFFFLSTMALKHSDF